MNLREIAIKRFYKTTSIKPKRRFKSNAWQKRRRLRTFKRRSLLAKIRRLTIFGIGLQEKDREIGIHLIKHPFESYERTFADYQKNSPLPQYLNSIDRNIVVNKKSLPVDLNVLQQTQFMFMGLIMRLSRKLRRRILKYSIDVKTSSLFGLSGYLNKNYYLIALVKRNLILVIRQFNAIIDYSVEYLAVESTTCLQQGVISEELEEKIACYEFIENHLSYWKIRREYLVDILEFYELFQKNSFDSLIFTLFIKKHMGHKGTNKINYKKYNWMLSI